MTEQSIRDFAAALASDAPTPGGGGASAAVCALGVALGNMVGALTVGKKKYADVEPEIRALNARAEALRVRLLDCVERDAAAFLPLQRAYGLPKDDPTRDAVMERCLRDAAAVPLEIFELSCEGIELLRDYGEKGSVMMLSDAATGVVFCWSAMYGAAVNVKVNTKLMRDRAYAEAINARVDAGMERYWPIAERVYEQIYRRYC